MGMKVSNVHGTKRPKLVFRSWKRNVLETKSQVLQAHSQDFCKGGGGHDDGGTEGPERGAEARSTVAPPQYGGLGWGHSPK